MHFGCSYIPTQGAPAHWFCRKPPTPPIVWPKGVESIVMRNDIEPRPLRIGVVAPAWFPIPPSGYGGIEWMVYWLVEGLVDLGHDVTLIAAGQNNTRARFIQTFEQPPSLRLGESFPDAVHTARAAKALSTLDLDVVHDHSFLGPLHAIGRSIPTIITAHGPVDGEVGDYYKAVSDNVELVAISGFQRRKAPHLPWAGMVYNGIPVKEYPFSSVKEDYVLFLGRLSPEKGAALAIDAAKEAGVRIVIAAKCNEPLELEYLETEIKPRLGPGVDYIGEANQQRKKDLLANARCLVFPIQWDEPFGIVMIEAMACGTPVIALPGGSVDEVIADGKTGVICRDATLLPAAIRRAGELDAAGCRAHVERHFDISRMVSGYVDVYRKAIDACDANVSLVNELSLTQLEAGSSRQLPSIR